jgi:RING finger protein 113A
VHQLTYDRCGHYFCEKCAIEHFRKSPKCFACGQTTHGVFAVAKDLITKLKAKKERMEKRIEEIQKQNTANLSGDEM